MRRLVIIQTLGLVLAWLSTNWSLLWEQSLCPKALIKVLLVFFFNSKPEFGCYGRILTLMFQPKIKFKKSCFGISYFFFHWQTFRSHSLSSGHREAFSSFLELWTHSRIWTCWVFPILRIFRDEQNLSTWLLQILSKFGFIYRQKNGNFTLGIWYCSTFDLCMFLKRI